jgi:surfactin synthase thioesterase subunit
MTATTRSRWLLCRRPRPAAGVRLYCFPHSGGSAGEYLRWSDRLPEVELSGLQLPGRGSRLEEEPLTTMSDLVSSVVDEVEFRPPYALFGHSLGALVAYETAQALRERGQPPPRQVFLSAYGAAHLHRPGPPLHELDGPALVQAIEQQYGPLPPELHEDPQLHRLVVRGLRGDLSILATYRHRHTESLDVPFVVLGGSDDEETPDRLAAWRGYTTGPFDLRIFAGDHFYFREQADDVLAFLAGALA